MGQPGIRNGVASEGTLLDVLAALGGGSTPSSATTKPAAPTGSSVGVNLAVTGTAAQFTSTATTTNLAVFTALAANTTAVYIGRGNGVTTSTGIELNPGDSITLPCANISEYWVIASGAGPAVRALPL